MAQAGGQDEDVETAGATIQSHHLCCGFEFNGTRRVKLCGFSSEDDDGANVLRNEDSRGLVMKKKSSWSRMSKLANPTLRKMAALFLQSCFCEYKNERRIEKQIFVTK
ncbi:unnamed protein product [Eruca vesicaria subsp. sativa]|uniref:Uncharacterized protein n=1 Tax=Eruca vesicaria subsp. sativa TaxID=29727 RepID=A0ABC8KU91_ERUVS|nr:unnamed protein product [Eruca vesicaria subsp. sativa]